MWGDGFCYNYIFLFLWNIKDVIRNFMGNEIVVKCMVCIGFEKLLKMKNVCCIYGRFLNFILWIGWIFEIIGWKILLIGKVLVFYFCGGGRVFGECCDISMVYKDMFCCLLSWKEIVFKWLMYKKLNLYRRFV